MLYTLWPYLNFTPGPDTRRFPCYMLGRLPTLTQRDKQARLSTLPALY